MTWGHSSSIDPSYDSKAGPIMLVLFCTSNLKEKLIEKVGLVVTPLLSNHVFIVRIDANSLINSGENLDKA